MSFIEIRKLLQKHTYFLDIFRKNSDRNYCTKHGRHHRYWLIPTIEMVMVGSRPRYGFDTKKELVKFVQKEFTEKK